MTPKSDEKIAKELTCCFKIHLSNLTNFDPTNSEVSKICTFMGTFWPKYIRFGSKTYQGAMFDSTEDLCKM